MMMVMMMRRRRRNRRRNELLTGRELEPADLPKCQKCLVDARCQWLDWLGADRAKVSQIIDVTKVYQVAEEHL